MLTNEQLQKQLDAIELAIYSGTTRVSYDGKSVEYRSLAEMERVRDGLRRQLGIAVPARRTVASFNGGF